jgi:hypothetical protein
MAAVHNLYIDQGADFSAEIGIYDDGNLPWDLNGYTGSAKIKKSYYSSTSVDFTVTVNTNNGTVSLSLPSSTTIDMEQGRYLYDVVITSNGGVKTRVIEGIVTINPGVTT